MKPKHFNQASSGVGSRCRAGAELNRYVARGAALFRPWVTLGLMSAAISACYSASPAQAKPLPDAPGVTLTVFENNRCKLGPVELQCGDLSDHIKSDRTWNPSTVVVVDARAARLSDSATRALFKGLTEAGVKNFGIAGVAEYWWRQFAPHNKSLQRTAGHKVQTMKRQFLNQAVSGVGSRSRAGAELNR